MASKNDRPYYSGKFTVHGLNVQVIGDPSGRLIWISSPLPGARHDIATAREHQILAAFQAAGIRALADTGKVLWEIRSSPHRARTLINAIQTLIPGRLNPTAMGSLPSARACVYARLRSAVRCAATSGGLSSLCRGRAISSDQGKLRRSADLPVVKTAPGPVLSSPWSRGWCCKRPASEGVSCCFREQRETPECLSWSGAFAPVGLVSIS